MINRERTRAAMNSSRDASAKTYTSIISLSSIVITISSIVSLPNLLSKAATVQVVDGTTLSGK
ncbi:hypothetical protein T02_12952 [Trichinella nativa]|uniref:Uncharacterized protein n=1 Tax=Trichinella nativa TaxID=6335 RepID=A0A0V1LEU4_9BILA|nr:hypothetical protein T02_12952 [Trichinella nativa]